ncbi:MAG: hypothetical protein V4813_10635 [Gemmatimonadota bacterium]
MPEITITPSTLGAAMPDQGREATPAPAARRAATSADAENAQLDAQLEVAAKKAALRNLEAQANGGPVIADAPMPPMPPGAARGTIMIERDGKTIVLENPTPEQLRQVGMSGAPQPDAKMIVTLTGATLVAIVLITWMVLNFLRRGRTAEAPRPDPEMAARMARIENAIESVAVEVERISEGQRFTSRLLSEGAAVPIVGAAQGERVMRANGEG